MNRALPPGISGGVMQRALDRFAAVVGREWVFTSEEDIGTYLDPFAPGNEKSFVAAGAVAPASSEEVQAVLRIAMEFAVPVWTVSAGKNLAYGGAAPRLSGSVVLDLKRMRHIEVDAELAYAVVEPGVTFFDLYDYLQAHKHPLWISSPAPGWGSVVGNALERGFGPLPYGDHSAQVCGMEVALADGSLIRTGMGGVAGASTFHAFKNGFGPGYDGLFMQSNLGVVTKLGIWLMPAPETAVLCDVKFRDEADLAVAIDTLRPLRISGTIASVANMRNALGVAAGTTARSRWWDKPGSIPDDVIDTMKTELNIGWWNMNFGLYGTLESTSAQLQSVRAAFGAVAGAQFHSKSIDAQVLAKPDRGGGGSRVGIPSLGAFQLPNWRGGAGAHIAFSPLTAARGADAVRIYQISRAAIEKSGLDFIGTFYSFGRALALICAVVFDKSNERDTSAVRSMLGPLIAQAGAAGFGEYRTHLAYMDDVAAQYAWNDHAILRVSRKIKQALDPKGILAPGKQGIWPLQSKPRS